MNDDIIRKIRENPIESSVLLKTSFKAFITVFHWYLFRNNFIFKPFHLKIINKLENIVFGKAEKPNLYIGLSPRFGKSVIMQYFTAWGFALNPMCNFLNTSYGSDLVLKFSGVIKSIIQSDLYAELFGLKIPKDMSAKDLWKIENGGEFRAVSLGGVITGFGAGCINDGWGGAIIIDDFMKADDYKSAKEKKNVVDAYVNTLKSRRNNKNTPIIVIAQRLAVDDLVGWIKDNEPEDWDFFVLPTLDDNEESIWEEKMPADTLKKMRDVHPFLFYSQYQQNPMILGGSVIKTEWFRYYPVNQQIRYSKIIITADTAMKIKEHNDFSVFGVWGLTEQGKLRLLDIVRGKWEAPDLKKQAIQLWNRWQEDPYNYASGLYVEDKASGTGLIQELKVTGIPIIPLIADKDKLTRVESCLTYIEAGLVELPESKTYTFVPAFLSECEAFTRDDSHAHDDQIDMMCYAILQLLAQRNVSILDVL